LNAEPSEAASSQDERARHWADIRERGAAWGPALLALIYSILGRTVCLLVMAPVILFFYVTGGRQRRASLDYLRRVWRALGRTDAPTHWNALKHFFAFGESLVDKFGAWTGRVEFKHVDSVNEKVFDAARRDPRGAVLISAHVGSIEVVRALATRHRRRRINIVIHTQHTQQYNAMLQRFAPDSQVSLVAAADFDVATAMSLSAAVERGEWVAIMGDRMPVSDTGRALMAEFLGAPTRFPQGPFVLAGALRCPVYAMFCARVNKRFRVDISLLSSGVAVPRRERAAALQALVQDYAAALQAHVLAAPYQWFNFYDYWAPNTGRRERS
jgi:predicted LPLAT superfamily acyltransferase